MDAFAAPGPRLTKTAAGFRLTCAYPWAASEPPPSCLTETRRILFWLDLNAYKTARKLSPGTVNAVSIPALIIVFTNAAPASITNYFPQVL